MNKFSLASILCLSLIAANNVTATPIPTDEKDCYTCEIEYEYEYETTYTVEYEYETEHTIYFETTVTYEYETNYDNESSYNYKNSNNQSNWRVCPKTCVNQDCSKDSHWTDYSDEEKDCCCRYISSNGRGGGGGGNGYSSNSTSSSGFYTITTSGFYTEYILQNGYTTITESGWATGTMWIECKLENTDDHEDAAPVPEPATMLLFGIGLASIASIKRYKNK